MAFTVGRLFTGLQGLPETKTRIQWHTEKPTRASACVVTVTHAHTHEHTNTASHTLTHTLTHTGQGLEFNVMASVSRTQSWLKGSGSARLVC